MNLPNTVSRLIEAQNNSDSYAYAKCFDENAIVHDEGQTHTGKIEIRQWIEHSNQKYKATLKALNYQKSKQEHLLTAEVSGNFPGSPAILEFHIGFENDLIQSLSVT